MDEKKQQKVSLEELKNRLDALLRQAQQAIGAYSESSKLFQQAVNVLGNIEEFKKTADDVIHSKDAIINGYKAASQELAEKTAATPIETKKYFENQGPILEKTLIDIEHKVANITNCLSDLKSIRADSEKSVKIVGESAGRLDLNIAKIIELTEQSIPGHIAELRDATEKINSLSGSLEARIIELNSIHSQSASQGASVISGIDAKLGEMKDDINRISSAPLVLIDAMKKELDDNQANFSNLKAVIEDTTKTYQRINSDLSNAVARIIESNKEVTASVEKSIINGNKAKSRFYNALAFIGIPAALIAGYLHFTAENKEGFTYSNVSLEELKCHTGHYTEASSQTEYCDPSASKNNIMYILDSNKDGMADFIVVKKGNVVIGVRNDGNPNNKAFFDYANRIMREEKEKFRELAD